ncbi:unnamed protein product [Vitrella brassicaformis CCMP3155]|uniref:Uncharacterized protein n=2 Tax=Vitrella brassicaformis TaxID=1169539 RepID=A0A0G4GVG2_VITBC|nr:unnamed protein product [Vitrella brassicaformis CCMP3155]|eukprot:CEM34735.1 unnamed protein product [Vitrella brassicaformis CCMP3155]
MEISARLPSLPLRYQNPRRQTALIALILCSAFPCVIGHASSSPWSALSSQAPIKRLRWLHMDLPYRDGTSRPLSLIVCRPVRGRHRLSPTAAVQPRSAHPVLHPLPQVIAASDDHHHNRQQHLMDHFPLDPPSRGGFSHPVMPPLPLPLPPIPAPTPAFRRDHLTDDDLLDVLPTLTDVSAILTLVDRHMRESDRPVDPLTLSVAFTCLGRRVGLFRVKGTVQMLATDPRFAALQERLMAVVRLQRVRGDGPYGDMLCAQMVLVAARMGLHQGQLYRELKGVLVGMVQQGRVGVETLGDLVAALAAAGDRDEGMIRAAVGSMSDKWRQFDQESLAVLASSFARLQWPDRSLFRRLGISLTSPNNRIGTHTALKPQHITAIVKAFSSMRYRHDRLLAYLTSVLVGDRSAGRRTAQHWRYGGDGRLPLAPLPGRNGVDVLGSMTARECGVVLEGLARLGVRVDTGEERHRGLVEAVLRQFWKMRGTSDLSNDIRVLYAEATLLAHNSTSISSPLAPSLLVKTVNTSLHQLTTPGTSEASATSPSASASPLPSPAMQIALTPADVVRLLYVYAYHRGKGVLSGERERALIDACVEMVLPCLVGEEEGVGTAELPVLAWSLAELNATDGRAWKAIRSAAEHHLVSLPTWALPTLLAPLAARGQLSARLKGLTASLLSERLAIPLPEATQEITRADPHPPVVPPYAFGSDWDRVVLGEDLVRLLDVLGVGVDRAGDGVRFLDGVGSVDVDRVREMLRTC